MTKKAFVLAVLLCFLIRGTAHSKDFPTAMLQGFVRDVYQDYAAEKFAEVYAVMHPAIHAALSEAEYVEVQQHHFARLSLVISEIEVGEVLENPRISRSLRSMLPEDEELQVYSVDLSYRAQFTSGIRLNQGVSKTVYVALANAGTKDEALYLLWDPSFIQEEVKSDAGD